MGRGIKRGWGGGGGGVEAWGWSCTNNETGVDGGVGVGGLQYMY